MLQVPNTELHRIWKEGKERGHINGLEIDEMINIVESQSLPGKLLLDLTWQVFCLVRHYRLILHFFLCLARFDVVICRPQYSHAVRLDLGSCSCSSGLHFFLCLDLLIILLLFSSLSSTSIFRCSLISKKKFLYKLFLNKIDYNPLV